MTESNPEFNPINPFKLSREESREYLDRLYEAQHNDNDLTSFKRHYGSGDLIRLINEGVIGEGVIIRQSDYGTLYDAHWIVGRKGLYSAHPRNGIDFNPTEITVLDGEEERGTWTIVGQDTPINGEENG